MPARLWPLLLLTGGLSVAGLVIWPGCATPPLPATRTPLSTVRASDFKFPRGSEPDRAELEARLGPPGSYFDDLNVACYPLNRVSRRRLWLFLGVLPIAAPRDPDLTEVALVQFDAQSRIWRVGLKSELPVRYFGTQLPPDWPGGVPENRFRRIAERWLAEPEPAVKSLRR